MRNAPGQSSLPASFPIRINRYGWGCLMIVPLSALILGWIGFIYFMWDQSVALQEDLIFSISMAVAVLFGVVAWIIGVRSQYTEKIEITVSEVSYFKQGMLRRTSQWQEHLMNYKGISTKIEAGFQKTGVEHETDIELFVVMLIHSENKGKNIILEKDALTREAQLQAQQHFARLLNLAVLN